MQGVPFEACLQPRMGKGCACLATGSTVCRRAIMEHCDLHCRREGGVLTGVRKETEKRRQEICKGGGG